MWRLCSLESASEEAYLCGKFSIFPTHVGVNLEFMPVLASTIHLPHTCGGKSNKDLYNLRDISDFPAHAGVNLRWSSVPALTSSLRMRG